MVERKKVTVFVDKFGKQHETLNSALRAEAYNDLMKKLDEQSAYSEMQIEDVVNFIDDNKDLVRRYIDGGEGRLKDALA